MLIPSSRWLRWIGGAVAAVALLWAVWRLGSLLSPGWDPRTILAIVIVVLALLAAMSWQHGWQWLFYERDPITLAALRARLALTTLPLPKTNVGRLGVGVLLLLALLWYASAERDDKGIVTYPNATLINPILGGLGALFLIYAAIRQARTASAQVRIASDRHEAQTKADLQRRTTESFSKAAEQLGSEKIEERIGGIYTLERLAREAVASPQGADAYLYWTVIETLTAFVRERAKWPPTQATMSPVRQGDDPLDPGQDYSEVVKLYLAGHKASVWPSELETDIQAVLTVIGRRPDAGRACERRLVDLVDLRATDLRGGDLRDAHLERALFVNAHLEDAFFLDTHLEGAEFSYAHLEGAKLPRAHLEGAWLYKAHLEGAILLGTHLEGATVWAAHLEGADLRGAHLERASLSDSDLTGAQLEGTDLSDVRGLTQAQIDATHGDETTKLPEGLTRPAHWTDPTAPRPKPPDLP